jgi:hypothetical protein
MHRFLSDNYWAFRWLSICSLCLTIVLLLFWCFDQSFNYEPLVAIAGIVTAVIGIPTLTEVVQHWRSNVTLECSFSNSTEPFELLVIGLPSIRKPCSLYLPIGMVGSAQIDNVALRVVLPTQFLPQPYVGSSTIQNQVIHFDTQSVSDDHSARSVIVPSLRIEEPFTAHIPVRLSPTDWIEVETADTVNTKGAVSLTTINEYRPTPIIGFSVLVTIHSDSARPIRKNWEVWFTESASLEMLEDRMVGVMNVARLWRQGHRGVRFPLVGNLFFLPAMWLPWREQLQPALIAQFAQSASSPSGEALYEFKIGQHFRIGTTLLANPHSKPLYRVWMNAVIAKRPRYFSW